MLFLRDVRSYAKVEPAVFKVRAAAPQRTCTRWVAVHLIGSDFPCLLPAKPRPRADSGSFWTAASPCGRSGLGCPGPTASRP